MRRYKYPSRSELWELMAIRQHSALQCRCALNMNEVARPLVPPTNRLHRYCPVQVVQMNVGADGLEHVPCAGADRDYRETSVQMNGKVIVVMVVSPGDSGIALDSLLRASALCPVNTEFFLADNTGDPATLADFSLKLAHPLRILPVSGAPRPYFEIARTVFSALSRVAPAAPELVIKIDPDTVVLSHLFFI